MRGYYQHVLLPHSLFVEGELTGNLVNCQSTPCDSVNACEGYCTGENSSPVGEGVWSMCSAKETVVNVVQFF